jgi:hypothetical protein
MKIRVITQGAYLQVIESSEPIAEGTRLTLFTEEELSKRMGYTPLEHIQLCSIFSEYDDHPGN